MVCGAALPMVIARASPVGWVTGIFMPERTKTRRKDTSCQNT